MVIAHEEDGGDYHEIEGNEKEKNSHALFKRMQ